MGHGQHAARADLDAGTGAPQLQTLFVIGDQFPDAVLGGGLQGHVQGGVHIESTLAPPGVALFRRGPKRVEVLHVFDDEVTEKAGVGVCR